MLTPDRRGSVSIKLYTLGRFEITLDDKPIKFQRKAQRRPLELLKALVAHGESGISVLALVSALWPAGEKGGLGALDVAIYRLRKLLTVPDAVVVSGQHVSINGDRVWVDVWELERQLEPLVAPIAGEPHGRDESIRRAAPLIAWYRGHFLTGAEEPWIYPRRDRAWSLYRQYLASLADVCERAGEWSMAANVCERAIVLEPTAEDFYRRLMACHARRGARTEAIAVYRRCVQALSTRLGIAPTVETERAYRELIARDEPGR